MYPQDGTGNAPLLYVLIHELGHALGIGHAELCGDKNPSVMESVLGGSCSPDQPELQPYDIENYRKAYRPGATGKPRVSRDGDRHLLTWDAGNVHTAHGFEIQQRLHGTAQWATVRWVAMNTSEPTQEGSSQRLYRGAVYEYRIVTTTRALPGTPYAFGDASAIAIEPGPTGDPPDRGDSSRDPPWPPAGTRDAAPPSPPVTTTPPLTAQCTLRTDASPEAGGSASAALAGGAAKSVLSGIEHSSDVAAMAPAGSDSLVLATAGGAIKRVASREFASVRPQGEIAMEIEYGDRLVAAEPVQGGGTVLLVSTGGMALRFAADGLRATGRPAGGVRGMRLQNDDEIVGLAAGGGSEELLVVSERGIGKRTVFADYAFKGRGGQGVRTFRVSAHTGRLVAAHAVKPARDSVFIVSRAGIAVQARADAIAREQHDALGVAVMKIRRDDEIAFCAPASRPGER